MVTTNTKPTPAPQRPHLAATNNRVQRGTGKDRETGQIVRRLPDDLVIVRWNESGVRETIPANTLRPI